MARITFPFVVEDGRLRLSTGLDRGGEALYALTRTHTGELPLGRDYGADLDYNIPLELAQQQRQHLQAQVARYHPDIELRSLRAVTGEGGTVMDWAAEAWVAE